MISIPVTDTAKLVPVPAVGELIKMLATSPCIGNSHRQIPMSAPVLKCVCVGRWVPHLYFSLSNRPVLHENFTHSLLCGGEDACVTQLKAANPFPRQHVCGILCGSSTVPPSASLCPAQHQIPIAFMPGSTGPLLHATHEKTTKAKETG